MTGNFLHCFCRHCGVALWVECDGILDTAPIALKCRETIGPGMITIGVNMRTVNDISQEALETVDIKRYRDGISDSCIMDATAPVENLQ
jgi:hypothetical protein